MNKTVGQTLRTARELKDITLQDAARATHIRLQYLQELENDHPELLPSKAQARGFLRLYAAFLDLDPSELLVLIESEEQAPKILPDQKNEKTGIREKRRKKPVEESAVSSEKKEKKAGRFSLKVPGFIKTRAKSTSEGVEKELESLNKAMEPGVDESQQVSSSDRASKAIFKEVGLQMRMRREKLGLTLSDVEQFTRLRRMYVQAIEEGRFEDLPSSVQGRGMVTNYAHFLEMDHEAVLNVYAEGLESQRRENLQEKWTPKEPPIRVSVRIPEKLRRILSPDLLFGSLVVIALFVFIFWGASQIFTNTGEEVPTEAPSISDMLQSTTTPTLGLETQTTEEIIENGEAATMLPTTQATEQAAVSIATANAAPLQLYIIAQQRAWLRVTVDGEVEFEGRTVPGNAYTFSGDNRILLSSGNGAALEVYFNQDYLGTLGEIGEVISLDFSLDGLRVPTPTMTPTGAPTATPTLTPTATLETIEDIVE